jgi:deoxyribose-phosphate aldolase
MYIDFALIDTDLADNDAKKIIEEIIPYSVNSITSPIYLVKSIKNLIPKTITVSCLIDYPLGISDIKTRRFAIEQAAKAGATAVDIAMPQNLAANRKYDKIRDDIKSSKEFCDTNNIEIRYTLEYRIFDHHCLKKICEIFENHQVKYVFPSTGFFLDNLADNILASIFLHQNSKDLNIISTGNVWHDKHFDTLLKSGLFGFRTTSVHSLKNFIVFNSSRKDK